MYNRFFVQIIVFEDILQLHTISLGDVTERLASYHDVDLVGIVLGLGLDIDDLVLHGLHGAVSIVEGPDVGRRHLHVARDTLIGVIFLGDDKVGLVVFKDLAVGERTAAHGVLTAQGGTNPKG